jgi:hypothetical protein
MQTKQEIYDFVVDALIAQGEQSMSPLTGVCQYRTNGLKCAVGMLISDEDYNSGMEELNVIDLLELKMAPTNIIEIETTYPGLLGELQDLHDSYMVNDSYSFTQYLKDNREITC